jgi:fluoride exporter
VTGVLVWIGVGALGGAGAILRFVLDAVVESRAGRSLPLGTFAVNVTGALALGALVGAAVHGDALLLAGTATIGSYTTFSTWMLETQRLGEDGDRAALALNVVVSLACGLGAVALGRLLGQTL